jgi:small-conductance mechanosensitive channel
MVREHDAATLDLSPAPRAFSRSMPASLHPFALAASQAVAAPEPGHILGFAVNTTLLHTLERGAQIAVMILSAVVLLRLVPLVERLVLRRATRRERTLGESPTELQQRVETLTRVTGSVARGLVWLVTIAFILNAVGVSVAPLVAGAGIVGIAVGFGAQSIVKDFFSGFFILLENQFSVGDTVTVAGITGTVEQMTLRITVLRDGAGTAYFIPNSNISNVANKTHGYNRVTIDASFGPLVPEEKIQSALAAVAARLKEQLDLEGVILEDPVVEGPIDVIGGAETWRVAVKAAADRGVEVKRSALGALRRELALAGLGYEAGVIVERPKAPPSV